MFFLPLTIGQCDNFYTWLVGSMAGLIGFASRGTVFLEASSSPHILVIFFCLQVVLETEVSNTGALRLYENLGFVRDKRLFRYYLNGVDALRLKLWLR